MLLNALSSTRPLFVTAKGEATNHTLASKHFPEAVLTLPHTHQEQGFFFFQLPYLLLLGLPFLFKGGSASLV